MELKFPTNYEELVELITRIQALEIVEQYGHFKGDQQARSKLRRTMLGMVLDALSTLENETREDVVLATDKNTQDQVLYVDGRLVIQSCKVVDGGAFHRLVMGRAPFLAYCKADTTELCGWPILLSDLKEHISDLRQCTEWHDKADN